MTSIAFGGGPTLSQRRDFAALKDGSQIPGYRGYIPQLKYSLARTYGEDTYQLSKSYDHTRPIPESVEPVTKRQLKNPLPKSTGDNKLTEEMVPGYTGYIPRWPFKFGGTYKEDCDVCIDEHLTNVKGSQAKFYDFHRATMSNPRLQAIAQDPQVRDHLDAYSDTRSSRPMLMEDKRSLTEPPMPGYQGYVPRIYTTENGLGCRYHEMTKNGLNTFNNEQINYRTSLSAPITIDRVPGKADQGPGQAGRSNGRRLYRGDGMVPKYTGYVPQRRFNFGNTYGDTTRSMDVCSHDKVCFGEFMKTRPYHPVVQC